MIKAGHPLSIHNTYINNIGETDNDRYKKPMKYESNRIASFIDWPVSYIRKEELAKAGFYYFQVDDLVRCAFCDVELASWQKGDNPLDDHRKWALNCPFVKGLPCGNVPMSEDASSDRIHEGYDTCGKYGITIHPNCLTETSGSSSNFDLSQFAIQVKSASHPNYSTYEERIKSFQEWPVSLKQKPNELAAAGFFYTGKSDQTICFYCGGGLKNWETDDVAWEQHARWFSKCSFLRLHKTPEYISKICNEQDAVLTPKDAEDLTVPNPSTSTAVKSEEKIEEKSSPKDPVENETTKDNEEVSKPTLCKICYTKEVGVVFLPCGHMVACVDCAPALSKCAVCRRELEATVRAFLS